MTEILALKNNVVYGFLELKEIYARNYTIGTALAIFLHLLLIGTYYFTETRTSKEEQIAPIIEKTYSDIKQTTITITPQLPIEGAVKVPTVGVPVPVPDEVAYPEQTIATQTEMARQKSNVGTDDFSNVLIKPEKIDVPVDINEEPDMSIFVPVEKQPEMVHAVTPEYPEIAKRAGITGKVYVKVLVDKEGRPKKTAIVKSDSELFNQAAIDAAMKSAFSPALQNQRPIAVWITLPYKFTLEGKN